MYHLFNLARRTISSLKTVPAGLAFLLLFVKSIAAAFGSNARLVLRMFLALGIAAAYGAIIAPNFVRSGSECGRNRCVANLKQIEGAKANWALENTKTLAATPTAADLYGPDAYIMRTPVCASGGEYAIGAVGEKPRCSLGRGGHSLDARWIEAEEKENRSYRRRQEFSELIGESQFPFYVSMAFFCTCAIIGSLANSSLAGKRFNRQTPAPTSRSWN